MAAAEPKAAPSAENQTTENLNVDATAAVISRWSDLHVSKPASVTTPGSEQDVISAIRLAKSKHLTIAVGGGGHATFISVDSSTLYMDMKLFQSIEVDKDAGVVRVGGGVTTGRLLKCLTENGLYTPLSDSNAVGVVGSLLGGGHNSHAGLHGYMVDNVISFRLVTAGEEVIDVDAQSTGSKATLFHALCGAGQGHGVVVSATIKVYPLAGLQLTDNKIWTRVMVFPSPALAHVVEAYLALLPVPGPLYPQLLFQRAPPGTPMAGSPTVVLSVKYFGPASEAEKAASVLFAADLNNAAVQVDSNMIDASHLNDALEPLNVHGGLKSACGARLGKITAKMITSSFAKWLAITDELPDAHRSLVFLQSFNPAVLEAKGNSDPGKHMFLEARDRGFFLVVVSWCTTQSSLEKLLRYADDVLHVCRSEDGATPRTIPNTMRYKEPLKDIFTGERIMELHHLKKSWDPMGVFWSPYVGAYRHHHEEVAP